MKIKLIDFGYKKAPERAHYNDSGADVFALYGVTIGAYSVRAVGLGFGVMLPDGYDAVIQCKSGLSKNGVFISNSPIDAGYRGEIHAIMYNATGNDIYIEPGQKIGQLVVRPVVYADFVTDLGAEREAGAFGSTGR